MRPSAILISLALIAGPAAADGPSSIPGDECDQPFADLETFAAGYPGVPDEIVRQWHEVGSAQWAADCLNPWAPPPGQFTDEELLGFLLSGHSVPTPGGGSPGEPGPAPVPIPPAGALLGAALAALAWIKRRRGHADQGRE